MNNPVPLSLARSLERIEELERLAAHFSRREAQLSYDFRARRHKASEKQRQAETQLENELHEALHGTEEEYAAAEEHVRKTFESRRTWLRQAVSFGIRNLPKRAQEAREHWQGELQLRHVQAERTRIADYKAAEETLAAYISHLVTQRARLADLEKKARSLFRGSPSFLRGSRRNETAVEATGKDPVKLGEELDEKLDTLEQLCGSSRSSAGLRIFSVLPVYIVVPLLVLAAWESAAFLEPTGLNAAAIGCFAAAVLALAGHWITFSRQKTNATALIRTIHEARNLCETSQKAAEIHYESVCKEIQTEYEEVKAGIDELWDQSGEVAAKFEQDLRRKIETQAPRITARITDLQNRRLRHLNVLRAAKVDAIRRDIDARRRRLTVGNNAKSEEIAAEENTRLRELQSEWEQSIHPIYEELERLHDTAAALAPGWTESFVTQWKPAVHFPAAMPFARLTVDLARNPEDLPKSPLLALPGPARVTAPIALSFPDKGSLLFETQGPAGPAVAGTLTNILLRLFAATPPGKLNVTLIDPVRLGENFAGFMHLADYEESTINRRIWTQRDQIEDRLEELGEHIEKVIQMYLRNEYATITEYNMQAGTVAEKYHFLVVTDFPAGFSETAARRLQSIAASGARCGVFTLVHWDCRQPVPDGFSGEDLRRSAVVIRKTNNQFHLADQRSDSTVQLILDVPPPSDLELALIHKVGQASVDSNRVEVPFSQAAPAPEAFWTGNTTNELRVAIGRTGATKLQYLAIGKGTKQHALLAGKTGSGKSTLLHVIITNLALGCSPDEVEFYLIDFKKGVEFKCYATKHLPHARVVAIESDREFGLSVLHRVDEELKRRGELFRQLGVQDVAGYRNAGGTEPLPRSLLVIDEFQEFFVQDDSIAQEAALLFDRIIRQGRAFGIHVLLGTQTLGGAYSLPRATLGQIVIRIALQCNEADAYLIMDDSNPAPRLLSRPGEGIYNDAAGAVEGNSPFQVVWLGDAERDQWLDKVRDLAGKRGIRNRPVVFEGNAPADVHENQAFLSLMQNPPAHAPGSSRIWLGAPNAIKGHTEVLFQRQSGNNLLIIGQRDETALSMMVYGIAALSAQHPAGSAQFILFHASAEGSPDARLVEELLQAVPSVKACTRPAEITQTLAKIADTVEARTGDSSPVFLFIHGLQRFRKLKHEDDFGFGGDAEDQSDGARLNTLIREGSAAGIHLILSVDTLNNVNRFLNRRALSEFEMRVLFQMSANDSSTLIDSPKASELGLHRALLCNEQTGTLETFRPYAPPPPRWLAEFGKRIQSAI